MNIEQFHKIHSGKPFLIVGLGPSAKQYTRDMKDSHIVIGVNDCERIGILPHYAIFLDRIDSLDTGFNGDQNRRPWIEQFNSPYMFLFEYTHNKQFFSPERWNRCVNINSIAKPFDRKTFDTHLLYYGADSPFVATSLAIYMGASSVKLLGVDYTDAPHAWGGYHKNNQHLTNLMRVQKDFVALRDLSCVPIKNIGVGSRLVF